jgi:hypothetical protein
MSYYFERPCKWKYRKCIDFNIGCDTCWNNIALRECKEENKPKPKVISFYDPIGSHYR